MDDNYELVHPEWLRRLDAGEISCEEAQRRLVGLRARLDFLQTLHSKIPDNAEFAEGKKEVKREMEGEAEEIKVVEKYIERLNRRRRARQQRSP